MKILRLVALCAIFALVFEGTAFAGFIVDISVTDFAFTPAHYTAPGPGSQVGWKNNATSTVHTATSDGIPADFGATTPGPSLWDTHDITPTTESGYSFTTSGTFAYHCTHHPDVMKGQIVVPLSTPPTGSKGNPFSVTWASSPGGIPSGFTEIVQMNAPVRRGRTRHWVTSFTATGSTLSGLVTPRRKGVYKFRARIKNDTTGGVSLFSPNAKVVVS